ncbi:uncharacterized protein [Panulirus ornatus]|uniref:uncharacterized protein isoform X2 n=1 Tax=Panulirus ornatus TaxID=150431 RepID=UPI003A8B4B12
MPTMAALRLVVVLSLALLTSAWDFTDTDRYQTWAADLKPGFMIQQRIIEGQGCYCKIPEESSSGQLSFSYSFNPSVSLTSSSSPSSSFEYHFLSSTGMKGNRTY